LQHCEESGGSGHRHLLNKKAPTEAGAEERNISKKVHFIGDGSPDRHWFPRGTGEVPHCAGGLLHSRAPRKSARTLRPNKVQKKKVGRNLCTLSHTQRTRYSFRWSCKLQGIVGTDSGRHWRL